MFRSSLVKAFKTHRRHTNWQFLFLPYTVESAEHISSTQPHKRVHKQTFFFVFRILYHSLDKLICFQPHRLLPHRCNSIQIVSHRLLFSQRTSLEHYFKLSVYLIASIFTLMWVSATQALTTPCSKSSDIVFYVRATKKWFSLWYSP